MFRKTYASILFLFIFLSTSAAQSYAFDFSKSTPVGSWQVREQVNIDHKGKKTVSVIRSSLLSEETRNGKPYVWGEIEMDNYKVKKDKRKKIGETYIVKVLMDKSRFKQDPLNVIRSMRGLAEEMIYQIGVKGSPTILRKGDLMYDTMMQAMGFEIAYSFTDNGTKTVTVPAGTFSCSVQKGSGKTQFKILIKKFEIESQTEECYSSEVPFGLVEGSFSTITNGKTSKSEVKLLKFGKTGAKSKITKKPQAMF